MNTQPLACSCAFRGTNPITPIVREYLTGQYAGRTVHIEISQESKPYWSQIVERRPNGGPMYGITIKRPNGESLDPDLSRCCGSLKEVREYLESL